MKKNLLLLLFSAIISLILLYIILYIYTFLNIDKSISYKFSSLEILNLHFFKTNILENSKMISKKSKTDWTAKMNTYMKGRISTLGENDLCGYIFKSKSPSCGIGRVPIYSKFGSNKVRHGPGMFASSFIKTLPLIPIEDEGRLHDPVIRENFIVRVFCFNRLQTLLKERFTMGALVSFHTKHKFLILSHSKKQYDAMGKLVATGKSLNLDELKSRYGSLFMEALTYKSTPKKIQTCYCI